MFVSHHTPTVRSRSKNPLTATIFGTAAGDTTRSRSLA